MNPIASGSLVSVAPHVFLYQNTCNVYIVVQDEEAILIDFGDGTVLDHLPSLGVKAVRAILMTHHHRDQGQGLKRATSAGIDIWVPHSEQELFHSIDARWQGREIYNNYNMRQDRFSLLESVPVAGTLKDYATYTFGAIKVTVWPTPGHTPGSITVLTELEGGTDQGDKGRCRRLAFTGDLIYGPGKVWSLAAMQWSYNGVEGVAMSILSLLDLIDQEPDLLLPSHGHPMDEPEKAMQQLVDGLLQIPNVRGRNTNILDLREHPYEAITPRLLINRTSHSQSYVLLSKSGKALIIDYGYDMQFGLGNGTDRAARRPWLYSLDKLKSDFGVTNIDVVIPTHFHDDHVAGFNLLKEVEHTEVWAAESFAHILERPSDFNLPCLWFDPIQVDKRLPIGRAFEWEEYSLTLHDQPGHTRYAVAIEFVVDGYKVLAVGDQQGNEGTLYNYVYENLFHYDDYVKSANLIKRLRPDLIIGGHWEPLWVNAKYVADLEKNGRALADAHRALLPLEEVDFGATGFGLRLMPYQAKLKAGRDLTVHASAQNPFHKQADVKVRLVAPEGWEVIPETIEKTLPANEAAVFTFTVRPPEQLPTEGCSGKRIRIAGELIVDQTLFGQQAEMLVDTY